MEQRIHDTPSEVAAEEGQVLVDGPGDVAVSMTPEAARVTSERLACGSDKAAAQRDCKDGVAKRDVGDVHDMPPDTISL